MHRYSSMAGTVSIDTRDTTHGDRGRKFSHGKSCNVALPAEMEASDTT